MQNHAGRPKLTPSGMALCHPDRIYRAHGLCAPCYHKNYYLRVKKPMNKVIQQTAKLSKWCMQVQIEQCLGEEA